jgi:hypothetical protein
VAARVNAGNCQVEKESVEYISSGIPFRYICTWFFKSGVLYRDTGVVPGTHGILCPVMGAV